MAEPDPAPRSERYRAAIAAIDAANAEDPNRIIWRGEQHVKELLHVQMMTDWVLELDPDADELQLIAARAHHLRRWKRPRSDYPDGRSGYLRWRAAAKRFHAEQVAGLLAALDFSEDEIARVGAIVRKEGLSTDPAVQTHDDALCLVFLATQLDDVAGRLGSDETVAVLTKTLPKLSPRGLEAAVNLPLDDWGRELLGRARAAG